MWCECCSSNDNDNDKKEIRMTSCSGTNDDDKVEAIISNTQAACYSVCVLCVLLGLSTSNAIHVATAIGKIPETVLRFTCVLCVYVFVSIIIIMIMMRYA